MYKYSYITAAACLFVRLGEVIETGFYYLQTRYYGIKVYLIKKVSEYAPDIKCCVGWDGNKDPMSMVDRAIKLGAYKIQLFKPYFNQETVDRAHENNILCNVFFADDIEEAKKYRKMGIDCILTNDYLAIKNGLEELDK